MPASWRSCSWAAFPGLAGVRPRIHDHADRNPRLEPLDDFVRVTRIRHEPEAEVDALGLMPNQRNDVVAAILVGDIAEVGSSGSTGVWA